jgi:hypothetical protein
MENVLDKSYTENRNAHFVFSNFFENRAVYKVMSKNMVTTEVPQIVSQYGAYVLHAG